MNLHLNFSIEAKLVASLFTYWMFQVNYYFDYGSLIEQEYSKFLDLLYYKYLGRK